MVKVAFFIQLDQPTEKKALEVLSLEARVGFSLSSKAVVTDSDK